MTAPFMLVGLPYVVTRESRNREFQAGDRITLYADGGIGNRQAAGWMPAEDVPAATDGMECKLDTERCA